MARSFEGLLALSMARGIGPGDCFRLPRGTRGVLRMLRTSAGRKRLSFMIGKAVGEIEWGQFDRQLAAIDRHGAGVVTFHDPGYPAYLRHIPEAPPLFFYKGDLSALDRRGVAIVGSRAATARGCAFAAGLAGELAGLGVMVASGAARGIDSAAHRGALRGGGPTVAVLGAGLDVPYPPENAPLLESIAENGCVLSEQLMGTPPLRHTFPVRNRLISGVSRAVVVVEAARKSGALVTARWAIEQGRDVGAVPGFPGEPRSRGVNGLIKQGAFLVEEAGDILAAVPMLDGLATVAPRPAPGPPEGKSAGGFGTAVWDALGAAPIYPDALAAHLGLPAAEVQRALFDLEMRGLVARDAAGAYYKK